MSQPVQSDIAMGAFYHREKAEAAVADLRDAGFPAADIGIASKNDRGDWNEYVAQEPEHAGDPERKIAGGAAFGAATGAGVGSLWALGIAAGFLPAIGPVIAGGLLASIVASAATGAAAGGMLGALTGLGLSNEEALYYEREFTGGRTIVSVRTRGHHEEATRILQHHGAFDLNRHTVDVDSTPTAV